jgi:hypothetical protein
MYGVNDVAWVVLIAILALLFVLALSATLARHGARPSGPALEEAEDDLVAYESAATPPREGPETLAERVETIIDVYRLDRNQPPVAKDLRQLADEWGPSLVARDRRGG